jgi:cation diffusion facilitator family transporter
MTGAKGETPLVAGLGTNCGLVGVKLAAGLAGHSQALIADALNSLLDVLAGVVAWVGYRVALRPPDKTHHYGHQDAETLAALFVGLMIFATGGIIIRGAIASLISGDFVVPSVWTIWVAAVVLVIKLALYFYTRRAARITPSLVVDATAKDHLMDVVATAGALVGVAGAQLGWPYLDPLAAFWVAGVILISGARILRSNVTILMGGAPSDETMAGIQRTLEMVPGVRGLHRTKVRTSGTRLYVDTEILVDGNLSVEDAHAIANAAGERLVAAHPAIADVVVHVEPHSARRAAEGADPLRPHTHSANDSE